MRSWTASTSGADSPRITPSDIDSRLRSPISRRSRSGDAGIAFSASRPCCRWAIASAWAERPIASWPASSQRSNAFAYCSPAK